MISRTASSSLPSARRRRWCFDATRCCYSHSAPRYSFSFKKTECPRANGRDSTRTFPRHILRTNVIVQRVHVGILVPAPRDNRLPVFAVRHTRSDLALVDLCCRLIAVRSLIRESGTGKGGRKKAVSLRRPVRTREVAWKPRSRTEGKTLVEGRRLLSSGI